MNLDGRSRTSLDLFDPDVHRFSHFSKLGLNLPLLRDMSNYRKFLPVSIALDAGIEISGAGSHLNMQRPRDKKRAQGECPSEPGAPAREPRRGKNESKGSDDPPQRRPPGINARRDTKSIGHSRPQHGLPRRLHGRNCRLGSRCRANRGRHATYSSTGQRLTAFRENLLNAPDGPQFQGGRFAETNPLGAPAGYGSQTPAASADLAPTLPDRTRHKQRVARPRSPTTAPRVLPGHFEAGPPPPGRAYEEYE